MAGPEKKSDDSTIKTDQTVKKPAADSSGGSEIFGFKLPFQLPSMDGIVDMIGGAVDWGKENWNNLGTGSFWKPILDTVVSAGTSFIGGMWEGASGVTNSIQKIFSKISEPVSNLWAKFVGGKIGVEEQTDGQTTTPADPKAQITSNLAIVTELTGDALKAHVDPAHVAKINEHKAKLEELQKKDKLEKADTDLIQTITTELADFKTKAQTKKTEDANKTEQQPKKENETPNLKTEFQGTTTDTQPVEQPQNKSVYSSLFDRTAGYQIAPDGNLVYGAGANQNNFGVRR